MIQGGYTSSSSSGISGHFICPELEYVTRCFARQNTHFELLEDKSIHYNTKTGSLGYGDIDWYGNYNYKKDKNRLVIAWKEGSIRAFINLQSVKQLTAISKD